MSRSKIVRLELLLLAAVTLLLAYRVIEGPPPPEGLVVLTDIAELDLVHEAVVADRESRVSIDAVGSFESDEASDLAAYGWILRRDDREVVWKMTPSSVGRERSTLARVRDTVALAPGTYDVFYTTYGNRSSRRFGISFLDRLLGDDAQWRGDAGNWRFVLRGMTGSEDALHRIGDVSDEALSPGGTGRLWSTAPMRGNESGEFVFHVDDPLDVRIYAIGEINDRLMDHGWIENAATGERVWEMTAENTRHAGGWDVNRLFDGAVSLSPAMYRAAFETDPRQNFDDWVGNPPFDPAGWGMTLYSDAQHAISSFDPWSTRTPIVQIDRVGDDERHSVQFRVHEPVQLAAYALGELGSNGRYDYAWIRDNESQAVVWEMTPERSQPAGGSNNRRELAILTLEPSTYTATYETDESHSYESWRHGRPEYPERWGVTIFPVAGDVDSTVVEVLGSSHEDLGESERADVSVSPTPPAPNGALPGETLVNLTRLGNDSRVSRTFKLEEPQLLRLRGVGEISLTAAPYDYGWIENVETGEIVWQMTWQNTVPAGGDDRNRMFDGTLSLPAGEYAAHFKTDFSHAYGDFGDQAPRRPEWWGLVVVQPEHSPQ
ncbi:MAG: hypothetical protein WD021_07145 [Rhodothermales bacterium]